MHVSAMCKPTNTKRYDDKVTVLSASVRLARRRDACMLNLSLGIQERNSIQAELLAIISKLCST